MSCYRQQAMIDAPVEVVWDLVSDVNHHPDWWPRVVEVECEGLEQGCVYRQVVKTPVGRDEMNLRVERLEDCRSLRIRCISTGTYFDLALTPAADGTFIDGEAGMEPKQLGMRVFDAVAGKRYFRSWLDATLVSLRRAAGERVAASQAGR